MTRVKTFLLFAFFGFTYLFFAAGYIDTVDADASLQTAKSLVSDQSFAVHISKPDLMLYRPTPSGGYISKLGLLTPILYVPSVILGEAFGSLLSLPPQSLQRYFVALSNIVITLLVLYALFNFLLASNLGWEQAALYTAIAAFATLLFPYSKTAHREPLQALCLLASAISLHPSSPRPFAAGVWAGLGLLAKLALVVPLLPFGIYACLQTQNRVRFLIPVTTALLLQAFFSYYYFGSPFETGYSNAVVGYQASVWQTPFWKGIYLQLFSPRTGLFYFCPVLLLAVVTWFHKKRDLFDQMVLVSIVLQITLYAKWWTPTGGEALGPRYLVVVLPLCFLWLREISPRLFFTPTFRITSVTALGFSLVFQVVNASIKPQQYWTLTQLAERQLSLPHWATNFVFFYQKAKGGPERYEVRTKEKRFTIDLTSFETLRGFNFWWLHAKKTPAKENLSPSL